MSLYAFHPELFEHRTLAIETLAEHGYDWFSHYNSVDLLHREFGLEICGIRDEGDARTILEILEQLFPEWPHTDLHYRERCREEGWKAVIFRGGKGRKNRKTD